MNHRTYLEIDLNKLEHNFNCVRNKLPDDVKILGVIKANAYGHGAVEIGKFLDDKCDFFGVACIEEAVELKNAEIKTPILILGRVFPFDIETAVKYDVRIPIFHMKTQLLFQTRRLSREKMFRSIFALIPE